jgi:hypothetical protein
MNTIKIFSYILLLTGASLSMPGCKKLLGLKKQTDYEYEHKTADPHLYKTAKQFLLDRWNGNADYAYDTVFKYMKLGLDYAGIDLNEYEQKGRTFIFLHNDAIKVWNKDQKKITAGFFYSFPIIDKDVNGNPVVDPNTGNFKTHPADNWTEYSKETVKNYFLYLIGEGEFNFDQLNNLNKPIQTLLPPGTVATQESLLGYYIWNDGSKGFDIDGKFNLKILNNSDQAPIVINDKTNDRSAGYIADNGIVHVFGTTVFPVRGNR